MSSVSSAAHVLHPLLAELREQFAAAKVDASELVNGLQESQFNWRPDSRSWSMAECLLHLNIVGERYLKVLDNSLAQARAKGLMGGGSGYGLVGRWILDNTEPPAKRKFKAPREFSPTYGQPITAVLPTFVHLQDQLARMLEAANGLDLKRVRVAAPGLGPVRLSLHVTLAWIAAHQRRHLWQARQVRNHAAFPAAK
jgi:hypothetical protein